MRQTALVKLELFIESLKAIHCGEWHPWALDIARQVADTKADIPVRSPLFKDVLFPALHDAICSGAAEPVRWLAGFSQLLYHSKEALEKLPEDMRSEFGLLCEAVRRNPQDAKSKQRLRDLHQSRFDYVLHELPVGVLYGHDGATIEQCAELLAELEDYKTLVCDIGARTEDSELIESAAFHISAYRAYLSNRKSYMNFSDYLSQQSTSL